MSNRWAVNIFFFINGFVFATWAARLPRLQTDYTLDEKTLGFLLLAHAFGAFIAMPITGWLITKYGSRVVTTGSGLAFPIFFIVIPWMPNYLTVFIPFFMMGAATGVMDVAMNAQAVLVEEQLNKPIMTMFHALFSIGMVMGGLASSVFTTGNVDLVTHFGSMSILAFLILLLTSRSLIKDNISDSSAEEVLFAFPKGPIIGLGIIAFCCMLGEGAMSDWSTIYMKDVVSIGPEFQTFGLIGFAALMTIGRLFGDQGRTLFGDRQMMIAGAVLSLLGMGFILSLIHPVLVIIGFGMVGLGLSNIVPIVYSLAGRFPDIKPGVGIAMSTTIGYSGFMIGPPLIGFLGSAFGLRVSLLLLAILFLMMLILVFQYRSTPKKIIKQF